MDQAWRRYQNDLDALVGILHELRLEREREDSKIDSEWIDQQIAEITDHIQSKF